jgi:hypothetical protein
MLVVVLDYTFNLSFLTVFVFSVISYIDGMHGSLHSNCIPSTLFAFCLQPPPPPPPPPPHPPLQMAQTAAPVF